MMAYGYMYAIEKPLRKIYPNDDDYYAALKRHTETFNITPHVSPFLMGLGVAMEEQNAKSEDFDAESVNNVKERVVCNDTIVATIAPITVIPRIDAP